MRLGIIGKGMIVHHLMEFVRETPVEAMALLARPESLESAQAFADEQGMEAVFTSFDALARWKPDAVYVAVPNHLHYHYTKLALEAGLNVILEKPSCSNVRQLEALIELADRKGVYLMEAMTSWYLPAVEEMRRALSQIGRLRLVSLSYCQRSSRYDAFREGRVLPAFDPKASGGSLMDINVYNVAAAVAFFGEPLSTEYHANVERGIDTSGTLTMVYPDFQVVAMGAKDSGNVAGGVFLGDEGSIRFDGPVSLTSEFEITKKGETTRFTSSLLHRMYPEFMVFSEIIKGGHEEQYRLNLRRSRIVARILEQSRKQAGVVFPADEAAL